MEIRPLTEHDAEQLWHLRLRALEEEPDAFAEAADEHRKTDPELFAGRLRNAAPDYFILGAFHGQELRGIVGFHRETRIKRRHRGVIWGMYVAPGGRGRGVGAALLGEAVAAAKSLPGLSAILLSVASTRPAARSLYIQAGFRPFGLEPAALIVNGRAIDEEHLVLLL